MNSRKTARDGWAVTTYEGARAYTTQALGAGYRWRMHVYRSPNQHDWWLARVTVANPDTRPKVKTSSAGGPTMKAAKVEAGLVLDRLVRLAAAEIDAVLAEYDDELS